MTVRIVTYNLLVPIYAGPGYYSKCQPKCLKTDYRWNLIQAQLEQEIGHHENTIICLQELCLTTLPKVELFFRRLKYNLFHNLYGYRGNDYMGVGIAIPFSIQVNSTSYIKSGDYIRSLIKHGGNTTHASTSESDPWKVAMDRYNTLICLQVVIDGKSLCIGTYHMPNQYDQPDVMAIHSSIIKDLMFELAAGQDFIFAGDFNREPFTKAYRALTEKGYHDVHFPKSNNYGITYQPNVTQVLKSAYREKNGSEPTYTNFSDTPDGRNYCATIDYIFFNGELTVEKVLELPDRPIGKSYPDETHPSDHLMIAATFRLSQLDKRADQRSPFWAKMWN